MSENTMELSATFSENAVEFILSEEIYPRDASYGTAYIFVDRCYLFLTRPMDKQVGVRLRLKQAPQSAEEGQHQLDAMAGEFANELLNQVLRHRIGLATADLRSYYMARAFVSTPAQTSIDKLLAELDAEELEEDDLEIAVPWSVPEAPSSGAT